VTAVTVASFFKLIQGSLSFFIPALLLRPVKLCYDNLLIHVLFVVSVIVALS
jgi:hypothetical protein